MANRLKPHRYGPTTKAAISPEKLLWEERAWELACLGMSQNAIAEELHRKYGRKVNQSTVGRWLQDVEKRFMARFQDRILGYKAKQVAMLESIYWEARQAWERSKLGRRRTTRKRFARIPAPMPTADNPQAEAPEPTPTAEVTTAVLQESAGDPRFLQEMRGAASDLRKLLGLDAEIKPDAFPLRDQSDEALARAVGRLNRALRSRTDLRLALPGRQEPINLVLPGGPERKPS